MIVERTVLNNGSGGNPQLCLVGPVRPNAGGGGSGGGSLEHEQPVPIFQQLARGHPSGRDDVRAGTRCRCVTSRICWPSAGSTSAMRPSGSGGTGLARCSPPRSESGGRANVPLSSVAVAFGRGVREDQRQALLSLARRRPRRRGLEAVVTAKRDKAAALKLSSGS